MSLKKDVSAEKTDMLFRVKLRRQVEMRMQETETRRFIHELKKRNEILMRSQTETRTALRQYINLFLYSLSKNKGQGHARLPLAW